MGIQQSGRGTSMGALSPMKTFALTFMATLIIVSSGFSQSSFEERRLRLLKVASGERERSFQTVAAKTLLGADTSYALVMLDSLSHDEAIGGMFYSYSLIGCYLHVRHLLPDSLHRKVRDAYRLRTMYRGDTENHWVMYYTGLYLAAQTWPSDGGRQWFNGKSSSENFREAEEWLRTWFTISSTIGQGEFDSPTYITTFVPPMLVLYDFAADSTMKKYAGMMLDLLLADFAFEHLKGNYGGGHSRDYPEDIINPLAAPSTLWAWLYFGEPEFAPWNETRYRPRHRGGWDPVYGALSTYRLPEIIVNIATDRATPYVHTETKRVRNVIRFGDQKNPPVFKYSYVTQDYVLGSLHGGILQPIQQHTWDVTYVSDKPNNTLFTLHPYYSGEELAMFFPEEKKFLADEVDRYHKVYTNPNKWNSSSPDEQTFQHRNAILVLYDIKPDSKHKHIDGFFSKNLDVMNQDRSGWILCKAGDTYIAFYSLRNFKLIEEEVNWRWRSHEPRNGVVVEIGSRAEDGSFERFQNRMVALKPALIISGHSVMLRHKTRFGDTMEFVFDGRRILNGKIIDFKEYRFFNGPFAESDLGSGIITLKYGNTRRVLNFNDASTRDYTVE